jgi:hypothetical protein
MMRVMLYEVAQITLVHLANAWATKVCASLALDAGWPKFWMSALEPFRGRRIEALSRPSAKAGVSNGNPNRYGSKRRYPAHLRSE